MHHPWSRLACTLVLTMSITAAVSAQPSNYGLSSYEYFKLQYTNFEGKHVKVEETDSYIPKYYFAWFDYLVTLWQIKIPGTNPEREVWVGAFGNPRDHVHFMGYFHPQGMPPGWRVDFLEQEFHVAFKSEPDLKDQRIGFPEVYGPTFYTADKKKKKLGLYPTFLQTQQVTIEDTKNGGCICITSNDDRGMRKMLGFETNGRADGVKFLVRYLPEQGLLEPNPIIWLPNWQIHFGYLLNGFEDAVDWYRAEQLKRPGSFLSQRYPGSQTMHPAVRECKFAVGVGATYSTIVLPNGQFDVSPKYRSNILNYFAKLHGDGMQLYHLGWNEEAPLAPLLMPDTYKTITPGHAALIKEADLLNKRIRSVGYSLPDLIHPGSPDYNANLVRLEKNGTQSTFTSPNWPGIAYRWLCYYPKATSDIYTNIYAKSMLGSLGFAGAYLDALSAQPLCYNFHGHQHPYGENEQLLGINRMVEGIRKTAPPRFGMPPMLFNETPTDSLPTDGSAIDTNTWDKDYWNIFRMMYDGQEYAYYAVVFGWDPSKNRPSGLEYTRELANALAGGARPIILWPEIEGLMPADPTVDFDFVEFRALLEAYIRDWDVFWKDIILGRQFEPLNPNDILSSIITPPTPLGKNDDPVTTKWRLPGYEPKKDGGCKPSRLRGSPSASVMTGLAEPKGLSGRRAVILYRWTDPRMARYRNWPTTSPLWQKTVKVTLRLSAQNTKSKPGALIRLYDPVTKRYTNLGRLPLKRTDKTGPINVEFQRYGVKMVVID
jgi:hypothetical protein